MVENKLNVYIDSNIWLGLYDFSPNNLEEFEKIKTQQGVKIFLPNQTAEEVKRNRISKISQARKDFEKIKFVHSIPNLYKEFTEKSAQFNKLSHELNRFFTIWKDEVSEAIIEETLRADEVIEELFQLATLIDTDKYYDEAVKRMNIGNPPGKNNSYGDSINWISLMDNIPPKEDLYIISDDIDFYDDKKNEIANSFLKSEWERKNESSLHIFNSLSSFFEKHLDIINLKNERIRNDLIEELEQSGAFWVTHNVIAKLNPHKNSFSIDEKERIINAAKYNSQIFGIIEDPDVKEFYCSILDRDNTEPLSLKILLEKY